MPKRTWPGTPAECLDRHKVLDLVQVVGHQRLRWTAADVRRQMGAMPHLQLAHPAQLGRHIAALAPVTVISLGQPMAELVRGAARASKTRHLYVLAEREGELATTPPTLPDPVRVYLALWVACRAAAAEAVDTNAVTRVCRGIEALAVDDRVTMNTRLTALRDRKQPLVEQVPPSKEAASNSSRWRQWRPVGVLPELEPFDDWVEIIRLLETDRPAASRLGHVTLHELVRELLELTIARTVSPAWPYGRSVTMTDVSAARADDARAAELDALVRRRGSSIGRVLGDATKRRIAGRARVEQRIAKVGTVAGEQTYYDLPGREGFEARALIVPYQQLGAALSDASVGRLRREAKDAGELAVRARALPGREGLVLGAIAAVRTLLVHRELQALATPARKIEDRRHLLSDQMRAALDRRLAKVATVRRSLAGELDEATATAEAALRSLGLELAPILCAPRPLLVGDDYAAWIPGADRRGRSGAALLADATTLRRFPNPEHTHRMDPDPRKAAVTGVDRVDALVGLAERLRANTLHFLAGGATLLGATLREPTLPRLLLGAADDRLWAQALAALVLLGDASAETTALAALAARPHDVRSAERALQALAVLRKAEPQRWPVWLRESSDRALVTQMHLLLNLPDAAKWLLRRAG